jgi:DnaK suppressor protein
MESENSDEGAGLSEGELRVLADRLRDLRSELLSRQRANQSVVLGEEEVPTEPMDAAEQTREQDDAILAVGRGRELLGEIDRALGKMASGTYGVSELSGRPIGFRRLQAIPWARLTADEEEDVET